MILEPISVQLKIGQSAIIRNTKRLRTNYKLIKLAIQQHCHLLWMNLRII